MLEVGRQAWRKREGGAGEEMGEGWADDAMTGLRVTEKKASAVAFRYLSRGLVAYGLLAMPCSALLSLPVLLPPLSRTIHTVPLYPC